jgi:hypothetical protein
VPGPQPQQAPALRVVSGQPTAEELVAVVAVLGAVSARAQDRLAPAPLRSQWAVPSRLVRAPIVAGPGAWRASALPR